MKKRLALLCAAFVLAACATQGERFKEARYDIQAGREEEGLARLQSQLERNPNDVELRNYYETHKTVAVQRYLAFGDNALALGQLDRAEDAYSRALAINPGDDHGEAGMKAVEMRRRHVALFAEAQELAKNGDEAGAQKKLKEILSQNPANRDAQNALRALEEKQVKAERAPKLNAALQKPITMEFRDAPLRQVFELISKQTGLNFIFDRDVPPDAKATVFVRDSSIDEVIRFVLVTNQLDRKVLNDNTVLIYPNTPAKSRDYKDLVMRSYYLTNADVKQTANMVRQLLKTRDLFIDEKLNLLVIRDTPEAIAVADKLIANQDKSEPEVMMEVEVLEVGENQLTQLGIEWPGRIAAGLQGAGGTPGQLTGHELTHMNSGLVQVTVSDPLIALNLRQQVGRTNVLANPRIRAKNREKAHIHIGDKVPVITTTAGATGFVSESVNYLDVGLKLDVEPNVYLDNEVGIKVGLEVSNVSGQVKTSSGTVAYQVGTRNTSTTLRLRDGETSVLAGLISNEDRRNSSQVPGIANLPVLGRLFQNKDDTANKTEVVLLITPHVIRNIQRPDVRMEQFNSG
ncbi:MAG TPA: secretin N-terminal domain-containing protein, partial [Burkholderiales bacterium]|nr:secretin N-terminal domain-containing protein [Burkholderiales bacterium]